MEINEIFIFRHDFGKREKKTCVSSSGMNAMFDIPRCLTFRLSIKIQIKYQIKIPRCLTFRLSVKFSVHIINNTREKIEFSCTNYFRPIVVQYLPSLLYQTSSVSTHLEKNDQFSSGVTSIAVYINKKCIFQGFTEIFLNKIAFRKRMGSINVQSG